MCMIDKRREYAVPPSRRLSPMLALAGLLVLGMGLRLVQADEPDPATQAFAQRLAIGVCGTCHGPHGNSGQPKFPRLASQNANYLAAQLKAFRGQTRGDPDALGYMWGMASQLDDITIEALAKYYSGQRAEPSASGRSELAARGKEIYEHGV